MVVAGFSKHHVGFHENIWTAFRQISFEASTWCIQWSGCYLFTNIQKTFAYTYVFIYTHIHIYIYEFYIVELSIYHATPPFLLTKRTEFLLPGVPATHQTVKAAMRFPGWPVTSNEDGFSESSVVSLNKIRRFFFEIKRNPPKKRSIAKKHLKMVLGFGSFGGLSIL